MLSIKSFSAGSGANVANYLEGGAAENYYGRGYWGGEASIALGLEGVIKEGELSQALNGRHPATGEAITNKVDGDHKPGYDCTFSMPKSLSLVYAAHPELREGIMQDMIAANKVMMDYLEKNAISTRHGHAGVDKEPVLNSGGILYSSHIHQGSRAGDPDLHIHNFVMNMTKDGRALDLDTKEKMTAGALARAELADLTLKRGVLAVERDQTSFKIAGVSKDLCTEYSKSRNAIEAELERTGLSGAESAAKIAVNIRQAKGNETDDGLMARVEPELKAAGLSREVLAEGKAQLEKEPATMPTTQQIINELVVNESTVSMYQLKAAMVQAAQGHMSGAEALKHFENEVKHSPSLVFLQGEKGVRVTNEATLELESRMLKTAERLADRNTHPVTPDQLFNAAKWDSLKPQQKEAVAHLTAGGDLVVLQGYAGTGKTYALGVAVEVWQEAGYQVIATAPSQKAITALVKEIDTEIIVNTTKLENMLARGELKFNEKTILIIDEGGMEGSRRINDLISKVEATGGKVVVQGDIKQHQSIEAGAPMRGIIEQTGAAILGHDSVIRQKEQSHRDIANDIREGRAGAAIGKMESQGMIAAYNDNLGATKGAAQAYVNDVTQGKDSILIATTNKEVNYLNQFVRNELQEKGVIAKEQETFATEKGTRDFARGDKVVFGEKHQFEKGNNDANVYNGSRGVVQAVTDKAVYVKLDETKEVVKVESDKFNKIDHGYAGTSHKAQGDGKTTVHDLRSEQSNLESAYTNYTRHKEEYTMHTTKAVIEREKDGAGKDKQSVLEKTMERSSAKDLSTDYVRVDPPNLTPPKPDQPAKEQEPSSKTTEQSKGQDNTKATPSHDLRQPAERAQAATETHVSTRQSNQRHDLEQPAKRAQAMAQDKAKAPIHDNTKATPEQRQASAQKLNEAIKAKSIETVKKVEAVKENTLKITVEKSMSTTKAPSKDNGLSL